MLRPPTSRSDGAGPASSARGRGERLAAALSSDADALCSLQARGGAQAHATPSAGQSATKRGGAAHIPGRAGHRVTESPPR
jgi:hypothetical protein